MFNVGKFNKLQVVKKVDFGVYLSDGSNPEKVLLPGKYVPAGIQLNDWINVFLYHDSEDRLIATTLTPKAQVGDIALLAVKDVSSVGVFLDWGLEKDLFVPFKEQRERMVLDHSYVVMVMIDRLTGRIMASNRFNIIVKPGRPQLENGQPVDLIVYDRADIGFKVLVNRQYQGFLYRNEIFQPVAIGDELKGFVHKIRPDNKLDVRLQKSGFGGVLEVKDTIMNELTAAGGFLPHNAYSPPEEIKKRFHMSKNVFKQAIGNLYKERRIEVTDDGIKLP